MKLQQGRKTYSIHSTCINNLPCLFELGKDTASVPCFGRGQTSSKPAFIDRIESYNNVVNI